MAEWRPAFDRVGRRIDVTGVPGLSVNATPGTLGHVLATLLENALHHGGGTVVVRRRTTGLPPSGSVVVEVSDAGPGVPAQLGQRVFERAVSGRSGTGLGLALARDLAEAGGGRLEMISRSPAVFAVFLPRGGSDRAGKQTGSQAGKQAGNQSGDQSGDQTGEDSRGSGSPSALTPTGARKTKRR